MTARSRRLVGCYRRHFKASFTAQCLLRRPFSDSIRSGTPCAPIPLSSSSASKSLSARRRKVAESFQVLLSFNCLLRPVVRRKEHSAARFPRLPLVGWLGQV